MFSSQGKHVKAIHTTSAAVFNEEIGGDTLQEQPLSHNSNKWQNKINAQATEIATVKVELNNALQENQKIYNLFNPDIMVEAMSKVVSIMIMKECLKTTEGTQQKSASSYVGRQRQPQLAHGPIGTLEPNISCQYCKDTGHTKDNCV